MALSIQFLDFIEEARDLIIQEWNFKYLLVHRMENLLELQKIYQKQRSNIKWATCGDADIRFFHINAIIKNRQKYIASIENQLGSKSSSMRKRPQFCLKLIKKYQAHLNTERWILICPLCSTLLKNLSHLEDPFSPEEINSIIATLPFDKSSSPKGFSIDFMKRCWPIISPNFFALYQRFDDRSVQVPCCPISKKGHSYCCQRLHAHFSFELECKAPN